MNRAHRATTLAIVSLLVATVVGLAPAGPLVATAAAGSVAAASLRSTDWVVRRGAATLEAGALDGSIPEALRISQDPGDDRVIELAPRRNPTAVDDIPTALTIDTRGDPGGRTLYVQVQDATGEIFHYRLGRPSGEGWQTHIVQLAEPPAATVWGDRDGVLDLPVTVVKLVLDPPSTIAPRAFSFEVARLRLVTETWDRLTATPRVFTPSAGEGTRLSFTAPRSGAFEVRLTDEEGRSWRWAGTASTGGRLSRSWNGTDSSGTRMVGSVRARLVFGTGADQQRMDVPYLAGVLTRRPPARDGMVNINTFLSEPDPSRRPFVEWQARRLEEARVSMARETFVWDRIEPRKGWFEWAKFDQAVEIAEAHGIDTLGVLAFSASWASSAPSSVTGSERVLYPPARVEDYEDYVRAVVQRYRGRVRTWEIWNEPNHPHFWRPGPNAEAYAKMLIAASRVIRAEDPGATVVLGGIVGTDVRYLDRLRAAGAWDAFDVLALHGYVRWSPEVSGLGGWFDKALAYVQRHGDRPIWLTEICWPLDDGDSVAPATTPATQAAYLPRTFMRAAEAGVSRVFWYSLVDHPSANASRYDRCGLFDEQRVARPAFTSMRTIGEAFDRAAAIGTADPAAALRRPVSPVAAAWRANGLAGGTGTAARAGATIRITYDLPKPTSGMRASTDLTLPGRPSSVVVGITGDGSAHSVLAAFVDATGERCSGTLGRLMAGTRRLRMFLDGSAANWTCAGGNGNGRLDAPVRLRDLTVHPTGIGDIAGSYTIRDIATGEGSAVRGVVLVSGRNQRLLLHHPPGSTVTSVGIPAGSASIIEGANRRNVTVSGGRMPFGVGPIPRLVQFGVGAAPATIDPGRSTMVGWVGADNASLRFQILDASGRSVRIDAERVAVAGPRVAYWNGRLSASRGTAGSGTYWVRLVFRTASGAIAYLSAPVTVR